MKNRVFYRHLIIENPKFEPRSNQAINTGITAKIQLIPEENKMRFSLALCHPHDAFERKRGAAQAEAMWEQGEIVEVGYAVWPDYYGALDMVLLCAFLPNSQAIKTLVTTPETRKQLDIVRRKC